ncbi:SRPBCC family protein [Pedosphaera parvula]|uniref:Activator of Hsp90 ATPase 1 family protein n=1 Tax=Pedosphaera parvula (strain Ellin514) TaxID=320771 RepID=B9XAB1_PEDPL|nr:SRPBCC family protein [Pedosphaera parvula]EEF63452.1 hypothetical protein Cflav_PD6087 [Pedosphaera parvula Ellin514]
MNLRLRERSVIKRPIDVVWRYVTDPRRFVEWNKKLMPTGLPEAFRQGETFQSQYQWHGRSISGHTRVEQLLPSVLKLHHSRFSGNGIRPDMEVIEEIQLTQKGVNTIVTKTVTIMNHGIPLFFVLIGWLIGNFGKRVEADYLKELCEKQESQSLQNGRLS